MKEGKSNLQQAIQEMEAYRKYKTLLTDYNINEVEFAAVLNGQSDLHDERGNTLDNTIIDQLITEYSRFQTAFYNTYGLNISLKFNIDNDSDKIIEKYDYFIYQYVPLPFDTNSNIQTPTVRRKQKQV